MTVKHNLVSKKVRVTMGDNPSVITDSRILIKRKANTKWFRYGDYGTIISDAWVNDSCRLSVAVQFENGSIDDVFMCHLSVVVL